MAKGEATEYQSGYYDRLSPELLDHAYSYESLSDRFNELDRLKAQIDYHTAEDAKSKAFTAVSKEQTFQSPDKTISQLASAIESYGSQKDFKEFNELLELRNKLQPGEFVLVDTVLYRIANTGREAIFTIEKPTKNTNSVKRLGGWIVLGSQEGSEEIVGFPVDENDPIGADVIKETIYTWAHDTARREYGYFTLDEVARNISILKTFGDADGIELITSNVGRQVYQELAVGTHYGGRGPSEAVFELAQSVDPELLQGLIDERAKHIATKTSVDSNSLFFYDSLISYRESLSEDRQEETALFDPKPVFDLYTTEFERGVQLLADS